MSGRRRSSTTQSKRLGTDAIERFLAGRRYGNVDILVSQQFADAHLLRGIVFDDQQPLAARSGIFLDAVQSAHRALAEWWAS